MSDPIKVTGHDGARRRAALDGLRPHTLPADAPGGWVRAQIDREAECDHTPVPGFGSGDVHWRGITGTLYQHPCDRCGAILDWNVETLG